MNNTVYALNVYNNELIAGGPFTTAGGNSAIRITKWNGTDWTPLGSGMNNTVFAITVLSNELIAGGSFTTAGGNSALRIAKWNGTSWSPLGSGLNGVVFTLTVYNNELIAGGSFSTAGGMSANNIAKWSLPTNIETATNEIPDAYTLYQNYPNPFNPETKINYAIPKQGHVTLKVYDISGREVMTLVNEVKTAGYYSINFNGNSLNSGVYFYRLTTADYTETRKMLLLK